MLTTFGVKSLKLKRPSRHNQFDRLNSVFYSLVHFIFVFFYATKHEECRHMSGVKSFAKILLLTHIINSVFIPFTHTTQFISYLILCHFIMTSSVDISMSWTALCDESGDTKANPMWHINRSLLFNAKCFEHQKSKSFAHVHWKVFFQPIY